MKPNMEKWVEGFMEHAAAAGIPLENVPALLKQAAVAELLRDPNFAAGFEQQCKQAGLEKEAQLGVLLKALGVGLAGYGAHKGLGALWRHINPQADLRYQMKQRSLADAAKIRAETSALNNPNMVEANRFRDILTPKKPGEGLGLPPMTERGYINPWAFPGRATFAY